MSLPLIYCARAATDMDPTPGHTAAAIYEVPSRSICAKASSFVAAHSTGALVLIIVMAVLIIFLYSRQTDFDSKGTTQHAHRRRVPHDNDLEVDHLINSINAVPF